jgi:hypothetical protein
MKVNNLEYSNYILSILEAINKTELSDYTKKTIKSNLNKVYNATKTTFIKDVISEFSKIENVNSIHTFLGAIKSVIKNVELNINEKDMFKNYDYYYKTKGTPLPGMSAESMPTIGAGAYQSTTGQLPKANTLPVKSFESIMNEIKEITSGVGFQTLDKAAKRKILQQKVNEFKRQHEGIKVEISKDPLIYNIYYYGDSRHFAC